MTTSPSNNTQSHSISTQLSFEKLTRQDIFQSLCKIIRLVEGKFRSTGFFALFNNKSHFVTVTQVDPDSDGVKINQKYSASRIQFDQQKKEISNDYNVSLLDYRPPNLVEALPLAPKDYEISEGTKVYYVGFSPQKNQIMFHEGKVSSIEDTFTSGIRIRNFTIDGTVLEGHLGSPVAVKIDNQLHLIGMIVSKILNGEKELNLLCKHSEKDVQELASKVMKNLSSSMGKAIDIRMIQSLISNQVLPSTSETQYSHLKKLELEAKRLPLQGCILVGYSLLDYSEWKPTNKKEEETRGVTIAVPWLGKKITYKFDKNPYDYSFYKENPEWLYCNGATQFGNELFTIPEEFYFKFSEVSITAKKLLRPFWNAKTDETEVEVESNGQKLFFYRWNKPSGAIGGIKVYFQGHKDPVIYLFEHTIGDESTLNLNDLCKAAGKAALEKFLSVPFEFSFKCYDETFTAKLESTISYSSSH